MAPKKRGSSARKKGKKAAPPPPPPVLIRINTSDDLKTHVETFQGSALLAIVSPICSTCTGTAVPALEKLNDERPVALKDTNLLVLYATEETREMCHSLNVTAVPNFRSFSYGTLVESFSGDNMDKVLLITKMAVQAATAEALRLAEEAKLAGQSSEGLAEAGGIAAQ